MLILACLKFRFKVEEKTITPSVDSCENKVLKVKDLGEVTIAKLCFPKYICCFEAEEAYDISNLILFFQVIVPTKELVLAGKDAAAEYDELAEPQDFQDDPE